MRNIWKVRNKWVKEKNHPKSCNKPIRALWFIQAYYTVNKMFTVFSGGDGHYFTRNDYWVTEGKFAICEENYRPTSSEYTQEDLLMGMIRDALAREQRVKSLRKIIKFSPHFFVFVG